MTTTDWHNNFSLADGHVELTPLSEGHLTALSDAANDGKPWQLWYTSVADPDSMATYIGKALAEQQEKTSMPFAVYSQSEQKIVGSTRYCNLDQRNRRLEIGYTWYRKSSQRTAINTRCKLLLLTHAFETLGCIAVEFRTHWFNQQSRRAIERLGAKQDGVLRNHQRLPDGSYRDTVVYSIIASEWLAVKNHLAHQLEVHQ